MSDDLVSRLREPLSQLPGDDDALMERVVSDRDEAATALTEARSEIERLRKVACDCATAIGNGAALSPESSLDFIELLPGEIAKHTDKLRRFLKCARDEGTEALDRAAAAESELSTIRARVREVVGPFAALEATGWTGSYLSEPGHDGSDVSVLHHAASNTTVTRGHFRAARQLMEEVK